MNILYIVSYLRRCDSLLKDISSKEDIGILFLWIDLMWSFVRYGCTIRQYHDGKFYNYRRH